MLLKIILVIFRCFPVRIMGIVLLFQTDLVISAISVSSPFARPHFVFVQGNISIPSCNMIAPLITALLSLLHETFRVLLL